MYKKIMTEICVLFLKSHLINLQKVMRENGNILFMRGPWPSLYK